MLKTLLATFFCLAVTTDEGITFGPPKPEHILVIGDSLACGSKQFIAGIRQPHETVTVDCKGGSSIDNWSKEGRAHRAFESNLQTDTVVIFLGTNDYYKSAVPDVEPLMQEVRMRNMRCVWAGPTAVYNKRWPITPKLRAAVENTCTFLDIEPFPLSSDKVHPAWSAWPAILRAVWSVK